MIKMENTENYINNEQEDEFEQAWQIKDDGEADWAIEKIAMAQTEIDRMTADCNEKINKIRERLEQFKKQPQSTILFMELKLKEYVETLNVAPTKAGTRIYNLPAGKVSIKPQAPKFSVDDTEFVSWLKNNGHSDLVKCTESGQWGELKKNGVIVSEDGKTVLTVDGELVEGVTVEQRDDVVKVEVI